MLCSDRIHASSSADRSPLPPRLLKKFLGMSHWFAAGKHHFCTQTTLTNACKLCHAPLCEHPGHAQWAAHRCANGFLDDRLPVHVFGNMGTKAKGAQSWLALHSPLFARPRFSPVTRGEQIWIGCRGF